MAQFFNFSGTERVKQNKKKIKNHLKSTKLVSKQLLK